MTKAELIEKIHETANGVTLAAIESVLDALASVGAAELLGGGEIPLRGLGKIKIKRTAPRKGCNPRTKEKILIPAGRKAVFVPSNDLKDALKV